MMDDKLDHIFRITSGSFMNDSKIRRSVGFEQFGVALPLLARQVSFQHWLECRAFEDMSNPAVDSEM